VFWVLKRLTLRVWLTISMRKIGYARVSTPTRASIARLGALRAERCDEIFREKASGKDIRQRPQLERAIDALGTGDILVRRRV